MHYLKTFLFTAAILSFTGFLVLAFTSQPSFNNETPILENDYNIYALDIPEALNFSGESMPLQSPDIRERIDRELLVNTYWQSNGLLLFKRSHKYFPVIEPILKSYGIPNDFKSCWSVTGSLAPAREHMQHLCTRSCAVCSYRFIF